MKQQKITIFLFLIALACLFKSCIVIPAFDTDYKNVLYDYSYYQFNDAIYLIGGRHGNKDLYHTCTFNGINSFNLDFDKCGDNDCASCLVGCAYIPDIDSRTECKIVKNEKYIYTVSYKDKSLLDVYNIFCNGNAIYYPEKQFKKKKSNIKSTIIRDPKYYIEFNNSIYLIAGTDQVNSHNYYSKIYYDIWKSTDGINWHCILIKVPWDENVDQVLAHNNELIVFAGNKIWSSADGINWIQRTKLPAGLQSRDIYSVVSNKNSLFIATKNENLENRLWQTSNFNSWKNSLLPKCSQSVKAKAKLYCINDNIIFRNDECYWRMNENHKWGEEQIIPHMLERYSKIEINNLVVDDKLILNYQLCYTSDGKNWYDMKMKAINVPPIKDPALTFVYDSKNDTVRFRDILCRISGINGITHYYDKNNFIEIFKNNRVPFYPRMHFNTIEFNDRLWLFGGYQGYYLSEHLSVNHKEYGRYYFKDIWCTDDGEKWKYIGELPYSFNDDKSKAKIKNYYIYIQVEHKAKCLKTKDFKNWEFITPKEYNSIDAKERGL